MLSAISFLHWPFLLLLPLAVAPWILRHPRLRRVAAIHSRGDILSSIPPSFRARTWWLSPALRSLAIALVVVSLARPVLTNQDSQVFTEGAAVELVVDRSGSMNAEDFTIDGKRTNRLNAVKRVATNFIKGGEGLDGRASDLVGLTVFARFADSISPLTTDHDFLIEALHGTQVATEASESGTAIGDAVALGVERLRDAMESANRDGQERVKGAALILMTDGENNAGDTDPMSAAELAKTLGVRIYAIGVGTRGYAPFPSRGLNGRTYYQQQAVTIDEELLTAMAEATGGRYFRATDTDGLAKIYEAIDALERTRIEQSITTFHRDLAVQGFRLGGRAFPAILMLAAACLLLDSAVAATWGRRIG
ncbi:MAG: VWA domain-containing protein [Planctomycetota bacterium]|nr:VWA domain-containing protein [Planctomycetota bacterium]MDA1104999.1 VWA domain-containing protein [Planctomycetota bacterium]